MHSTTDTQKMIDSCLDVSTGEVIDVEELYNVYKSNISEVENLALLLKEKEKFASQMKEKALEYSGMAKKLQEEAEKIRKEIETALNGEEFQTKKVYIRWANAPKSVSIEDESKVIAQLKSIGNTKALKVREEINKTELKKMLEVGWKINGATITQKKIMKIS